MKATIINSTYEPSDEYFDLGAATIASVINASANHVATAIDFSFVWDKWECYLTEKLLNDKPEIIGIPTYSPRMHQVLTIARKCKQLLPEVKVVLGGHHASLDTLKTLKQECVDYVVVGEAELTIIKLLDTLQSKNLKNLHNIPFLAFKENGALIENKLGMLPNSNELNELPFVDWTLWEHHKAAIYHCGFLPIIGVRGCPYKCTFCSSPILAKRLKGTGPFVRQSSAVRTAKEAAWQYERHQKDGLRYLMFYDQNFLMDIKWLKEFCDEYKRLGLHKKLNFSCYTRLDHLSAEKLEMVKSAGCIQLRIGIESGNVEIRNKLLNKRLTQKMLLDKLKLLKESEINSLGYFIIGNPNETYSQALESFTLAKKMKLNRAAFFFLTPLHNLPIQDEGDMEYMNMEKSLGFSLATGLTNRLTGVKKFLLLWLFYRSNGYFLLKNIFVQLRKQGFQFLSQFPKYFWKAREDGFDLQKILLQYVYYHGDSYKY